MPVAESLLTLDLEAAIPASPAVLVTTAHPSLYQHPGPRGEAIHPRLGRLVTPRHYPRIEDTANAGILWAADNDCFQGLDAPRFLAMLDRVKGLPGCKFVTVPDVVADARATAAMFDKWAPAVERRGLPVALVAQDGIEDLDEWLALVWHRLDAVFIGGSTEWKEGPHAAAIARRAHAAGKWVHWGRVNTLRRLELIARTGAGDSTDGTKFARFRNTYLDGWLRELAALEDLRELGIELAVRAERVRLLAELGDLLVNADTPEA